jgi:choline monooxygenase
MSFLHELARFDRQLPIEQAPTPPSSWYTDAEFDRQERSRVLLASWQPVARLEQVATSGSFVSGDFAGEPYLVVRGEDGVLRAFYNVCRHHAAQVAQGEGCASEFVCPYHGWTYRTDGRLRSAPRLGAVQCFNRNDYGLRPIELQEWGLWVWLRFVSGGPDLATPQMSFAGLRFHCQRSYELDCNWKVFVDNYLDGGYHVEYAHPALAAGLDLDAYRTEVLPRMVLQTCGSKDDPRLEGGAIYAWMYPNFMLNRYGPVLDTNLVLPLGPDRCLTVFDYYFDEACDADFIEHSLAASHHVQLEDVTVCEAVQRGLRSSGYDVGRYAPSVEMGEFQFHHWLAEDLGR